MHIGLSIRKEVLVLTILPMISFSPACDMCYYFFNTYDTKVAPAVSSQIKSDNNQKYVCVICVHEGLHGRLFHLHLDLLLCHPLQLSQGVPWPASFVRKEEWDYIETGI